uniref:Uncharacterized protein n=1 Tax=Aegilops tauschii subsp. strangulata TaxID=200361 RepID=A0A453AAN7_AEGTS
QNSVVFTGSAPANRIPRLLLVGRRSTTRSFPVPGGAKAAAGFLRCPACTAALPSTRSISPAAGRHGACLYPTAERARRGAMNHRRPLRVTQLALARVHAASGDASDRDDEGKFASESNMPSVRPSGGARLSGHNCEMSVSAR